MCKRSPAMAVGFARGRDLDFPYTDFARGWDLDFPHTNFRGVLSKELRKEVMGAMLKNNYHSQNSVEQRIET